MALELDELIQPLPPVAAAPAPPRPRLPWHAQALQIASAYLPVLLMALLALSTWWLVRNTPRPAPPPEESAARHEPDYLMQGARIQRFAADGSLRVQVEGTQMRHYPDTDTIEVDAVTIRAFGRDGGVTVATARRALANGDASEVQLQGGARVVREADARSATIEFESEFLHAFFATERVRSHLPVRVRQGASELRVGALDYDHLARTARLGPPIRARFEAPGRR